MPGSFDYHKFVIPVTLVDTHSHLFLPAFDQDRDEVVQIAIRNGVKKILMPDVDAGTTNHMLDLADRFPDHCFPMIGLHPTSVKNNFQEELKRIKELLSGRKFWGIGETGIDLYWDKTFIEQQRESFKVHIFLAREHKLPLVIHCRESFSEITRILDMEIDDSLKGIFHAFTGNIEEAQKIISYGFKIGIGGIVTFKNSGLAETVKSIDLRHIVLETDSPYLAPSPFRGKRNESSYLVYIVNKLADIYDMPPEKIAEITTNNANEIFGLGIEISSV